MKQYRDIIKITILNTIYSLSEYISLAILALYINEKLSLINTTIVISLSTLIPIFFGATSVIFEKNIGRRKSLILSNIILLSSYCVIISTNKFGLLLLAAVLQGISRILWQPIIKTLFIEYSVVLNNSSSAHRLRYITICIAGLLGPMIGAGISNYYGKVECLYCSIVMIFVSIIIIIISNNEEPEVMQKCALKNTFSVRSLVAIKDASALLWVYILVGTLVFFVFVQFENTYSLYFKAYSEKPENIFSLLLILNSMFGIILQIVTMKLKINNSKKLVSRGMLFFILAFTFFAFSFEFKCSHMSVLVIAIFIYSVGEVTVIPALDMLIDEISSDKNKILYFGLAEIRNIGFMAGPIFAGMMLEYTSPVIASVSCVMILVVADLIFVMVPHFIRYK